MSATHQRQSQLSPTTPTIIHITDSTSSSPDVASSFTSQQLEGKSRCFTWTKLTFGALVPLMIAVGTVAITVLQQKLDTSRQMQERELDDRRYNLERLIDDRRYTLEQEQADELHYQDVFRSYIADISNAVFKQQQSSFNQMTFENNEKRFAYIRSQTLTVLSDLDWHQRTRLFRFLHENDLLPRVKVAYDEDPSLDLSGAYLANITMKSTVYKKAIFVTLSLPSVDLTNSSFIGCEFHGGADFSESLLNDAKFSGSVFKCITKSGEESFSNSRAHTYFDHALLQRADFQGSKLCDINLENTDLAYANFNGAWFDGSIEVTETNLAFADFTNAGFHLSLSMLISNVNMTGSCIMDNSAFKNALRRGDVEMNNVILPNGSWLMHGKNLVSNGNAETGCSSLSHNDGIWSWGRAGKNPKLSRHQKTTTNGTSNECFFNFTYTRDLDDELVSMQQIIKIDHVSVFIDSSEAVYHLSVVQGCIRGNLDITIAFWSEETKRYLSESAFTFNGSDNLQWLTYTKIETIPMHARILVIEITREKHTELCYLDDIELYIRRGMEP